MSKNTKIKTSSLTVLIMSLFSLSCFASADRQPFLQGGLGMEVLSSNGSGTGFYFSSAGGYAFSQEFALGLDLGYSNIGGVGVRALNFGTFFQYTHVESSIYGRAIADLVYASTDGGVNRHGVDGSQVGFAPGVAVGILIPGAGDLHFAPELSYRCAFLKDAVSLFGMSATLVYDF